ncbi:MAG: DUF120 domain-containing protein [Cyanophyceae cyanobacterium]
MAILRGQVVSGLGNFSYWIERLQAHYQKLTGMTFFPGTLNLQLEYPYSLPQHILRLEKEDYGGTVSVNLMPCRIFGRRGFILRTDTNESGQGHHPQTIIEIACDVKLREQYGLKDGDFVEVELDGD